MTLKIDLKSGKISISLENRENLIQKKFGALVWEGG